MKLQSLTAILILVFFAFGCGLMSRSKGDSNTNVNVSRIESTASPTLSETSTPDAQPSPSDKASLGRNRLAFGAGAVVAAKTSESASSTDAARMLIDEAGFAWQTAQGQIENQSVTLELPAQTTFKTFVFDTAQPTYYDGRGAKDVMIEISDESATSGFQTILEATLKDSANKNGVDNQAFAVSKEIPARFVRYTAKNNDGSPVSILTKELSGYGEQEPRAAVPNISGTYEVPGIVGDFHIKQDGNSIIGCYKENDGTLEGTIDGRVLTLTATENNARAKGEKTSFVAGNVVDGGKTLLSTWWSWSSTPQEKNYDHLYIGTKKSDMIGNCPQMPDLDGAKDAIKDSLEKELTEKGKAILYGINFDFNSDVIKAESRPTLDKVIAILKEKTDWKFSIEGHTDNIGGDAFNQTLSEKRAAAVVKYLTAVGIDASRLSSKGYGLTRPIAPNDSESERAQNRRVELVKGN